LEKKAKKEQADLEKKTKAEAEKKPAEKKKTEAKKAEVKPAEKEVSAELKADVVEETVNAKVFEFEGKKYLKTDEGILYDQATEECVGVWNEETKSIDDFADDEE
jgi:hypothetical protein